MRRILRVVLLQLGMTASSVRLGAQPGSIDTSSMVVVRAFTAALQSRDAAAMARLLDDRTSVFSAGVDSLVRVEARGRAAAQTVFGDLRERNADATFALCGATTVGPWAAASISIGSRGATGFSNTKMLFVFDIRSDVIRQLWIYPVRSNGSNGVPKDTVNLACQ